MIETSLIAHYKILRSKPTPAKELILYIISITGRKEITVRKWLDGSTTPDGETVNLIEQSLGKHIDEIIQEYYQRLQQPTHAAIFRNKLAEISRKSAPTVLRYLKGYTRPDYATQTIISINLDTPISILFP